MLFLKTEIGSAYISPRLSEPHADGVSTGLTLERDDRDHHLERPREAEVIGSISPLLIQQTGMTTDFYSYLLIAAGLAPPAYFTSLTDRIGRASLIVYGTLAAGLIAYFGVPSACSM